MPFTSRLHPRISSRGVVADTPTKCSPRVLASWWWVWLLTTLVALTHGPVCAEWVPLDPPYQSPGLQTVYADLATIHRAGQFVTLWQLTDYRWKQGGMIGRRVLSSKTQKEFDCAATQYRTRAFRDFSGHMGTGDARDGYVENAAWRPVNPDSVNQGLWNVACDTH